MRIILFHKQYSEEHLAKVTEEMKELGAPTIRAIWSEMYGEWMAVEGCHRIRAAKTLGLTPIIEDISEDETVTIECDGYDETFPVSELFEELQDGAWQSAGIKFEED